MRDTAQSEVKLGSCILLIQFGNNISSSQWKEWSGQYRIRERARERVKKPRSRLKNFSTLPMAKHFFPEGSRSTQAYFSRDPIEAGESNHKTPDSGNKKCTSLLIFRRRSDDCEQKTKIQMNGFHPRFWRDNSLFAEEWLWRVCTDSCITSWKAQNEVKQTGFSSTKWSFY